jgi:hypothetical protein
MNNYDGVKFKLCEHVPPDKEPKFYMIEKTSKENLYRIWWIYRIKTYANTNK